MSDPIVSTGRGGVQFFVDSVSSGSDNVSSQAQGILDKMRMCKSHMPVENMLLLQSSDEAISRIGHMLTVIHGGIVMQTQESSEREYWESRQMESTLVVYV